MSVLVGADPELFVTDRNKNIVSAIHLIGGSKDKPVPVPFGALQEDNVLAEFNIDPADNQEAFLHHIEYVQQELIRRLPEGFGTSLVSSYDFDMDYLRSEPKALEFGCNPDMNAYTVSENIAPVGVTTSLRTAGGHVHIGYDMPEQDKSLTIVKACDIALGIPSVLFDPDTRRRSLYGKAGACRLKAYGVEYRTLSNFWLRHPDLVKWVFNVAQQIGNDPYHYLDLAYDHMLFDGEVNNIINTSDKTSALKWCNALGLTTGLEQHYAL